MRLYVNIFIPELLPLELEHLWKKLSKNKLYFQLHVKVPDPSAAYMRKMSQIYFLQVYPDLGYDITGVCRWNGSFSR